MERISIVRYPRQGKPIAVAVSESSRNLKAIGPRLISSIHSNGHFMRACVQRVSEASVAVGGEICGQIGRGLVVLLGVAHDDTAADAAQLAEKIVGLRIFDDADGKMNLSLAEVAGDMLVVSQFTLLGDCRKGRRPSFVAAAPPELAEARYEEFVAAARGLGITVATGQFRQHMLVSLVNDGPVTMLLDTTRVI